MRILVESFHAVGRPIAPLVRGDDEIKQLQGIEKSPGDFLAL